MSVRAFARRYGVDRYTASADLIAISVRLGSRDNRWAVRPAPTPKWPPAEPAELAEGVLAAWQANKRSNYAPTSADHQSAWGRRRDGVLLVRRHDRRVHLVGAARFICGSCCAAGSADGGCTNYRPIQPPLTNAEPLFGPRFCAMLARYGFTTSSPCARRLIALELRSRVPSHRLACRGAWALAG